MNKIILCLIYLTAARGFEEVSLDDDKHNPYYNNFGSKLTICPYRKNCLDNSVNFLCAKDPTRVSPNCKRFVPMKMTHQSRSKMMHVHNGLRNKLAYDMKLSNMNLVYWNVHLEHMAEQYLQLCRPYRDTCLIVGYAGIEVGQNSLFVPKRNIEVLNEWEGRTVRHWFLEFGGKHFKPHYLIEEEEKGHMGNLTQFIWPKLEFIGCSAAIMFDGFFIVCYYYPPVNSSLKSELTFLADDETCVCPKSRLMCSLVFTSLCGIDLQLGRAMRMELRSFKIYILLFLVFSLLKL